MDNMELEVTEVTETITEVVEETNGIEIEPLFEETVDFDTFSKSDFRVVKVKECIAHLRQRARDRRRVIFFPK